MNKTRHGNLLMSSLSAHLATVATWCWINKIANCQADQAAARLPDLIKPPQLIPGAADRPIDGDQRQQRADGSVLMPDQPLSDGAAQRQHATKAHQCGAGQVVAKSSVDAANPLPAESFGCKRHHAGTGDHAENAGDAE